MVSMGWINSNMNSKVWLVLNTAGTNSTRRVTHIPAVYCKTVNSQNNGITPRERLYLWQVEQKITTVATVHTHANDSTHQENGIFSESMQTGAVENILFVKRRTRGGQSSSCDPWTQTHLWPFDPAHQVGAHINLPRKPRPRKTGFGQIHAYKEAVCLVSEVYFVNSEGDYVLYVMQCHPSSDGGTSYVLEVSELSKRLADELILNLRALWEDVVCDWTSQHSVTHTHLNSLV